jgi:hypothetical protein
VASLDDLFDQAQRASPGDRIDYRDPIASHGADGLPRLAGWLQDERLGLFAARTMERIAKEHRDSVLQALYRNGEGIVAIGQAAGPVRKRAYQGKAEHPEEEFYRDLDPFQRVIPPASAGEIKDVTGQTYSFRGTLFTMGEPEGERLLVHLTGGATH